MKMRAGVAAGHPSTAQAGADILSRGGSAVDAAVAMMLVSCAAETIFTGLGGGGFATVYDATNTQVRCLDFFVGVPGAGSPAQQPAERRARRSESECCPDQRRKDDVPDRFIG